MHLSSRIIWLQPLFFFFFFSRKTVKHRQALCVWKHQVSELHYINHKVILFDGKLYTTHQNINVKLIKRKYLHNKIVSHCKKMYRQNITEHNILYIKKHVHGGQRRESETTFDANIKCRHYWTVMSWMSSTVFNNQEWVASMSLCPLVCYRVLTASNANVEEVTETGSLAKRRLEKHWIRCFYSSLPRSHGQLCECACKGLVIKQQDS